MDKEINPLSAAIVIIAALAIAAAYAWYTSEMNAIRGPGPMAVDNQGALYVATSAAILKFDNHGKLKQELSLDKIGIQQLAGDIAVFSNGDVLLSAARGHMNFFQRLLPPPMLDDIEQESDDTDLLRCNLQTTECRKFTDLGIRYSRAFRLEIDPQTDEVYLADTDRHLIRKFSRDGKQLASHDKGWWFPNGLKLYQGRLYVSNLGSGSFKVLDPASMQIAEHGESGIKPSFEDTANYKSFGPIHVTRAGEEWWSIWFSQVRGTYFIKGFSDDWKSKRTLVFPGGAMPNTLVNYRDGILLSDPEHFKVYRYNFQGQRLDKDFSPESLTEHIRGLREQQQAWRTRGYMTMAGLGLVVVLGFVYAFATGKKPAASSRTMPELRPSTVDPRRLNIGWLKPAKFSTTRLSILVVRATVAFSLLVVPLLWMLKPDTPKVFGVMMVLLLFTVLLAVEIMAHSVGMKSRIGIGGKCLLIKTAKGKIVAALMNEAMYSKRALYLVDADGDVHVALFDTVRNEDKERFLEPRLKHALQLSSYQEQMVWGKVKKPVLLLGLPAFLIAMLPVLTRLFS